VSNPQPPANATPEQAALIQALRSVLEPLAVLAVAKGLTYQVLDDVLKQARSMPRTMRIPVWRRIAVSAASAPPPASIAAR
jgi:hypothetical protein